MIKDIVDTIVTQICIKITSSTKMLTIKKFTNGKICLLMATFNKQKN